MNVLTPNEARARFGELTCLSKGITTWLIFKTKEGVWSPEFAGFANINLVGYILEPNESGTS